jgi:hypothetical protein
VKVFQNVLSIALLACCSFGQEGSSKLHVGDAKTAIRIGKAELIRRYGRQVINSWTVNTPQWCQEMLPAQTFYCHGGHWVRISGGDGRVVAAGDYPDLAQ